MPTRFIAELLGRQICLASDLCTIAQRSATGLSGMFRAPALSTSGKRGDIPANSRRRLRTWPKLMPGSSLCTSPKTSPLASLVGSHHPRPAWLTIRISPLPRRYFRLSLVLSFRSSFHGGGFRSSTTAQCTLSRSSSISGSCPVMSAPRVLSAGAGLNGLGLVFAPALPADREAVALQGRAERAGACDAPLAARPAPAVAIPLSFASQAKAQRRRREQEIGPVSRGSTQSGRQGPTAMTLVGARAETFAARPRMRPEKTTSPAWRARVLGGGGRPPTGRTCLMLAI